MNERKYWILRRVVAVAAALLAPAGCRYGEIVAIGSGFDFLQSARPSLTEDGRVTAARMTSFLIGDGTSQTSIDLSSHGLTIEDGNGEDRSFHLGERGDIVLLADRNGHVPGLRGAYHLDPGGAHLTVLHEEPWSDWPQYVNRDIGLAPNGMTAFSQMVNVHGAIYRGPAAGPVTAVLSGSSVYHNTGSLDVNDGGMVAVQMEYYDVLMGLVRGVFVLSTPEQDLAALQTAIEGLDVGRSALVAINAAGEVAFSLDDKVTVSIGGVTTTLEAGVYRVMPTPYHTPKSWVKVASKPDGYCRFGTVDINDAGTVVFEASVEGDPQCSFDGLERPEFSGLFSGPSPNINRIITAGDARLEGHRYFDSVRLGELNNGGQISFLTRYTEPPVPTFAVWRWSP